MPGPLERLAELRELSDAVVRAVTKTVMTARDEGASWTQIGASLGITRQAAQQRFSPRRPGADISDRVDSPAGLAPRRPRGEWSVTTVGGRVDGALVNLPRPAH